MAGEMEDGAQFESAGVDMVLSDHHNPSILSNAPSPPGAAPDRDMPNEDLIREIATQAWSEALQEKSQELAENIARRMGAALGLAIRGVSPARAQPRSCAMARC